MDQYEQTRIGYRFCEQWCSRSEIREPGTNDLDCSEEQFFTERIIFFKLLKTISFVTK